MDEKQKEQLYHLLPSIYRLRDQAQGEPLRVLMNALEGELRLVEEDIAALYDNWFIETCDEWTIPYLANHVGAYSPDETAKLFPSQRRQVANTIAYRRRKGLKAILEHALADVTGWAVICVEYAHIQAEAQRLADLASTQEFLINLRQTSELILHHGPFETVVQTTEVSRIEIESSADVLEAGQDQPDHVGVLIWRLHSYPMKVVPARAITHMGKQEFASGCFTFDPLGRDMPLFNQPQTIDALAETIAPVNLPIPLDRLALAKDLEEHRQQQLHAPTVENVFEADDLVHNSRYYGPDRALCILINGAPLLPSAIISADLSQWDVLPINAQEQASRVAVDVALGRLRFLDASHENATVAVNYSYGFSADIGGGPYTRVLPATANGARYRINVLQGGKVSTLQQALALWDAYCRTWQEQHQPTDTLQVERPRGTIHIVDSGLYADHEFVITLPKNSDLVIEATNGVRPVIEGHIKVNSEHGSTHLRLNGLLIDGKLSITGGTDLEIGHCTLMPHGLETLSSTRPTQIAIDHSIVGLIHLRNRLDTLTVSDSIVDHASDTAIIAVHGESEHGPVISVERATIFGRVHAHELRSALNVLFTGPVVIQDQQHGLVSFSYVPAHSQTPRRERCLSPSAEPAHHHEQSADEQTEPLFTSTRYGDAAYAQLATRCSHRIKRGADNGSEMGVFNSLHQAQRQDNITHALDEYLPFGLTAGVFYRT